jgi:hypothetical protein
VFVGAAKAEPYFIFRNQEVYFGARMAASKKLCSGRILSMKSQ